MKTISISLARHLEPSSGLSCYRVANHCLAVDRPVAQLEPFRMEPQGNVRQLDSADAPRIEPHHDNLIYDSEAWVGSAMRRTRLWFDGCGHEIHIDGIGAFSITGDGRQITLLERQRRLDDAILIEAVLGPALIVALAINGIFCLHASAVTLKNSVILFLGDSGAGKSTMASILQSENLNIFRVTDDISPLGRQENGFDLLPDFPQLKLTASQQCVRLNTPSAGIDAIYQLNRVPAGKASLPPISRERLSAIESFKALVGQSVASRLFPKELLRRHTQQIAGLTAAVPLYRLTYPSGLQHAVSLQKFLLGRVS